MQIPTPDGPVALKVPAGTESGKLLRVKGRGAPKLNGGGKGDLLARVQVTVPRKLTKAEREALEGYQEVSRERPRSTFDGWDLMPDRPRYMISVAADLVGMHPQTLRLYEAKGLVSPGAHARWDAALLRAGPRAAAADPAADRPSSGSTTPVSSTCCGSRTSCAGLRAPHGAAGGRAARRDPRDAQGYRRDVVLYEAPTPATQRERVNQPRNDRRGRRSETWISTS